MKKVDLKKMALLGITGGLLIAGQSVNANNSEGTLLAGGCGGGHCGAFGNKGAASYNGNSSTGTPTNPNPTSTTNPNPTSPTSAPGTPSTMPNSKGYSQRSNTDGKNIADNSQTTPGNMKINIQTQPGTTDPRNSNANFSNSNSNGNNGTNDPKFTGSMSEADLLKSINAQSRETYENMSPEGKTLALELANQACKGQNSCKGMNSCKTANNSCAGKGACKGKSACAFKDKNTAVKVAAAKMASKRASLK